MMINIIIDIMPNTYNRDGWIKKQKVKHIKPSRIFSNRIKQLINVQASVNAIACAVNNHIILLLKMNSLIALHSIIIVKAFLSQLGFR